MTTIVGEVNALKEKTRITPTIDMSVIHKQLVTMEHMAFATVNNIRQMFNTLFGGGENNLIPSSSNKFKHAISLPTKELEEQVKNANAAIKTSQDNIERVRNLKDIAHDDYRNRDKIIERERAAIAENEQKLATLKGALRGKGYALQQGNTTAALANAEAFTAKVQEQIRVLGLQNQAQEKANELAKEKEEAEKKKGGRKKKNPAPNNISAKDVEKLEKTFGKDGTKTYTYILTAKKSDTFNKTVKSISEALNGLKPLGEISIKPLVDPGALTKAQDDLDKLAKTSAKIVNPFTSKTGKSDAKGGDGKSGVIGLTAKEEKTLQEKLQKQKELSERIQKNKDEQQTMLNKRTGAVKKTEQANYNELEEQIKKDQKALSGVNATVSRLNNKQAKAKANVAPTSQATQAKVDPIEVTAQIGKVLPPKNIYELSVNAKILPESVTKSIESITPPTINVNARMQWGGKDGKGESIHNQLKALSENKKPTLTLKLDTTTALGQLNEFIELIRGKSPQNIVLTASGTAPNSGQASGGSSAHLVAPGGSVVTAPTPAPAPTHGLAHSPLPAPSDKSSNANSNSSIDKQAAPTGYVGRGKNLAYFGADKPLMPAPKGMQWVAENDMTPYLTTQQSIGYGNSLQKQRTANAKLAAETNKLSNLNDEKAKLEEKYNNLQSKYKGVQDQITSLQKERKGLVNDLDKSKKENSKKGKVSSKKVAENQTVLQNKINELDRQLGDLQGVKKEIDSVRRKRTTLNNQITDQERVVRGLEQDQKAPGAYKKGYRLAPNSAPQTAQKLRDQLYKSINRMAKNSDLANAVVSHKPTFKKALKAVFGSSSVDISKLSEADRLAVAQAARGILQGGNKSVSPSLNSFIADTQRKMAEEGARSAWFNKYAPAMPDKLAKFAYANKDVFSKSLSMVQNHLNSRGQNPTEWTGYGALHKGRVFEEMGAMLKAQGKEVPKMVADAPKYFAKQEKKATDKVVKAQKEQFFQSTGKAFKTRALSNALFDYMYGGDHAARGESFRAAFDKLALSKGYKTFNAVSSNLVNVGQILSGMTPQESKAFYEGLVASDTQHGLKTPASILSELTKLQNAEERDKKKAKRDQEKTDRDQKKAEKQKKARVNAINKAIKAVHNDAVSKFLTQNKDILPNKQFGKDLFKHRKFIGRVYDKLDLGNGKTWEKSSQLERQEAFRNLTPHQALATLNEFRSQLAGANIAIPNSLDREIVKAQERVQKYNEGIRKADQAKTDAYRKKLDKQIAENKAAKAAEEAKKAKERTNQRKALLNNAQNKFLAKNSGILPSDQFGKDLFKHRKFIGPLYNKLNEQNISANQVKPWEKLSQLERQEAFKNLTPQQTLTALNELRNQFAGANTAVPNSLEREIVKAQEKVQKYNAGVIKADQAKSDAYRKNLDKQIAENKALKAAKEAANQKIIDDHNKEWEKLKAETAQKVKAIQDERARQSAADKKAASKLSIANHKNTAQTMLNNIANAIRPYVANDTQAKQVAKSHRQIIKTMRDMGVSPRHFETFAQSFGSMSPQDQLAFYSKLQENMSNAGVALPKPIQNNINAINEQINPTPNPKAAAPTGFVGSGKSRVQFGGAKPDASLAPSGYHWKRTSGLAPKLNAAQSEALSALNARVAPLVDNVRQVKAATAPIIANADALARQSGDVQALRALGVENGRLLSEAINAKNTTHREMANLRNQIDAQKNIRDNYEGENKAQVRAAADRQVGHLQRIYADKSAKYGRQDNAVNSYINQGRQIQADTRAAIDAERQRIMAPALAQREAALAPLREVSTARKAYTSGWSLEQSPQAKALQYKQLTAFQKLRPLVSNDMVARAILENFGYAKNAVRATGSRPSIGMAAITKLNLMKKIVDNMTNAKATVPPQFYDEIKKLEQRVALDQRRAEIARKKASRMSATTGRPMSNYDRFRKWGFPFTGATSFGSRPPMAFEMAKGMGMMFAIGGAMSAIGNSFSQAMEYQNVMKSTESILKGGTKTYTKAGFENMEGIVRDVGVKTKFSAPEVASATKFLAMAGYDIGAINNSIRPIADLALIGGTDLGETADKMTNIMTTFNIRPENMRKAANIMVTTATRSNTDLMMLAESAKYGGAVANMYGKGNPDIFAETMALFGIMGNSGIQGSSAGTALRMMYMNLFNPNKKQAELLAQMKKKFDISVTDKGGRVKSLADIVMQMANKIPADEQAQYVSKLFRITAQAGANSVISASDISAEDKQGAIQGLGSIVKFMESDNGGISKLKELIEANKASVNSNISSEYAEAQQNTLSGLMAQVTSMFTETIVKAMENRAGDFASMAEKVRDFFADPETVKTMQNIIDMITEIGKIMGWFAGMWAKLYGMAPGLIKFWVVTQMAFTQFGSLLAPFTQLSGALNRLKTVVVSFLGIPSMVALKGASGGMGRTAYMAASNGMMVAPMVVGARHSKTREILSKGRRYLPGFMASVLPVNGSAPIKVYGRTAKNMSKNLNDPLAVITAATLMHPAVPLRRGESYFAPTAPLLPQHMTTSGATLAKSQIATATTNRYLTVAQRANNIFGAPRVVRNWKAAASWGLNMASWTPMLRWIKTVFFNVLGKLGTLFGALCNPITITIGAFAGLAYLLNRLHKQISGTTEAQIAAQKNTAKLIGQSKVELDKINNWYSSFISGGKTITNAPLPEKTETQKNFEEKQKQRDAQWSFLGSLQKDASKQNNKAAIDHLKANISGSLMLSQAYGKEFKANFVDILAEDKLKAQNQYAKNNIQNYSTPIYQMQAGVAGYAETAKNIEKAGVHIALAIDAEQYEPLIKALPKIAKVWEDVDKGVYKDNPKGKQDAFDKIYNEVYDSLPHSKLPDPTTYQGYLALNAPVTTETTENAVLKMLDANINALPGTLPFRNTALHNLLNGKLVRYSEEWNRQLSNYLSGMNAVANILGPDGTIEQSLNISLEAMANGKINMNSYFAQIRAIIPTFKDDLRVFLNSMTGVYKLMALQGIVPDTPQGFTQSSWKEVQGQKVPIETMRAYYNDVLKTNANSWVNKLGWNEQQFVDEYTKIYNRQKGRMQTYLGKNVSKQEVDWQNQVSTAAKYYIDQNTAALYPKNIKNNNNVKVGDTNSTSSQDDYADTYGRNAAKPTQVVFNINNLCAFDNTAITKDADEQAIIEEMQPKVTNAVWQMFAAAVNSGELTLNGR